LEQLSGPEIFYPLEVFVCTGCSLTQLGYVVPPDVLFGKNYPYETGVNEGGKRHFAGFAESVNERFSPLVVLDIGSNDGTLLSGFKGGGCQVLGIEPCAHIAQKAVNKGVQTIPAFWGKDLTLDGWTDKVDVITAANVFAHVPDLHGFMECVERHLARDGVLVIESPYLVEMIDNVQYDTIYHEHMYYWHLRPLSRLVSEYGMTVFDVEPQRIHGGSMRYFIGRKGIHRYVKHRVREVIEREKDLDLSEFSVNVRSNRFRLNAFLNGKTVVGVGAAAKGNTLLNYCEIDLPYIIDIAPAKVGKFSPGRHIQVMDEEYVDWGDFSHVLVLAWNWQKEIIQKLRGLGFKGGFIIPVPEPRIV
jgi:SAM-dependent methyltransferase